MLDYEVIIVDDGTPDNSMTIVERYVHLLPMTILHQENKGLSSARNTGLRKTIGKYVWFVDSDDAIAPGIFEQFAKIFCDKEYDVYGFQVLNILPNTSSYREYPCSNKKKIAYFNDRPTDWHEIGKVMAPGLAQRYIFRREFLKENKLEFMEGIIFEDMEFNVKVKCLAKTICFKDIVSYHYHRRESGSIMSSLNMKAAYSIKSIIQNLDEFRKRWPCYDVRYSIVCHHSFIETCDMLSLQHRICALEYYQFYNENRWRYTFKGIFYFIFGLRHLSKVDFYRLFWLLFNPQKCGK